jgi:hypothetical protein
MAEFGADYALSLGPSFGAQIDAIVKLILRYPKPIA